ncbi:MAG: hypothetical protein KIS78_31785 [Labilithrix sp.]|nr:hypothetical protein [Labilithrix sp.]
MSSIEAGRQVSVEELMAYNATLLERHKRLRVFRLFTDGTLEDPAKRELLFACVQVFARHFQTMLYTRQAHCADDFYRGIFLQHLREEVGHDDILVKDRGRRDEVWDPIMEGSAAWFVSRMSVLDNIEKAAVMHLVLESSGAYMGSVCGPAMRRYGSADYFELHDEVDQSHVTMVVEPLRRQSPETLARVRVTVEQAWRVLDVWVERVATLVLGDEAVTYYPAAS